MQVHTPGVIPSKPRIFLTDLGSLELSHRAKGVEQTVDVTLPFTASMGPSLRPHGIKIAGRNINKLRYADDTTIMAEREEERVCRGTS